MNKALTLVEAMSNTGKAVASLVSEVKAGRGLRKKSLVILEEELHYLKYHCHMKGLSQLTQTAFEEMERSKRTMEMKQFSGDALVMAAEMLRIQFQAFSQMLQRYAEI